MSDHPWRKPLPEPEPDPLLPHPDVVVSGCGAWDYGPGAGRASFTGLWPPDDASRPQILRGTRAYRRKDVPTGSG